MGQIFSNSSFDDPFKSGVKPINPPSERYTLPNMLVREAIHRELVPTHTSAHLVELQSYDLSAELFVFH
jgi:hypothetical protein